MDIQLVSLKFFDYSTFIRGYAKPTISRYKVSISLYCRHAGITQLEEVTNDNVRNFFYYGRIERKWSPNSFICYHKSLLVFFRWCIKEGYMKENPVSDIEMPKLEKRIPPKLSKQEALRLLEVVYNFPYAFRFERYRNHAIFSMFLFAGVRMSELMNLKFTDVDIENMQIYIRQGKGNKDRIIPICYTLADTLKKYIGERARLQKTCPEFFASLNRNLGITKTGLKYMTQRIRDASGTKFTIHKLRHTFATLMLEGGCDIYALSRMMGHSDIKTTTIYLAATVDHLRGQMTKHPLNNF